MKKLKSTKFFPPYSKEGAANLKHTGVGAYIIKERDRIVYVGMSAKDVKGTLYRHFQKWTDRRTNWTKKGQNYERVTYHGKPRENYLIKVIYTPTAATAAMLEEMLILKFKPRDNTLKLELYTAAQILKISDSFNDAEYFPANSDEPPF